MKYLVRTGSMKRFSRLLFIPEKALLRSWRNEGIQRSFRSDPFILRIIYAISLTKTNVHVKFCCSELVGSLVQSGVNSEYQLLYKYNTEVHLYGNPSFKDLSSRSRRDWCSCHCNESKKMCFSQMKQTTLDIVRTVCFSVQF